jgi:hypothetical protein
MAENLRTYGNALKELRTSAFLYNAMLVVVIVGVVVCMAFIIFDSIIKWRDPERRYDRMVGRALKKGGRK